MKNEIKKIIASAIANARGMRRGAPSLKNVLAVLPDNLSAEVFDDADNIIKELENAGYEIIQEKL